MRPRTIVKGLFHVALNVNVVRDVRGCVFIEKKTKEREKR